MLSIRFIIRTILNWCFFGLFLAACTAQPETAVTPSPLPETPTISAATTVPPSPTAVPPSQTTVPDPLPADNDTPTRWINAIIPVPVYSGPDWSSTIIGYLEVGVPNLVLGREQDNWIPIQCPDVDEESCWLIWDYNALYPYEGSPKTLTIPDPADLNIDATNTAVSPDGRWHTTITRSETVVLVEDAAWIFYVELKVTSQDDGTTWMPVSEWHSAGLGEEGPPALYHWSEDGRYLYYTSTFDYHGVQCALYFNIGDILDRLDLSDGSLTSLTPPRIGGISAISSDERWIAYFNWDGLTVRDLTASYLADAGGQDLIKWQFPADSVGPDLVSELGWSVDNSKVFLTTTKLADNCALISRSFWELDIETGSLILTETLLASDTPSSVPCTEPAADSTDFRRSYLIFCGDKGHVHISHNNSLIVDEALTIEAYVNYLGGGSGSPRVIEIIDTFNLSFSENKVWFCLYAQGWSCLSGPQPEIGQWVHLAGSWDGQRMTFFIDGQLTAETDFPGPIFHDGPGDQSLKIGNGWTLIDGFNGFIDEVRFSSIGRYDADFTPESLFTADEFTIGLWHFDDGQGSLALDESDNQNFGVLNPFVKWGPQR